MQVENGQYVKPVSITNVTVAVPVDVQYSAIKVAPIQMILNQNVPGTGRVWGTNPTDWSSWSKLVLRVNNTHNQAIDITLNYVDNGDFLKADGTPQKFTIPANKSNVLITPTDWPILGQTIAEPVALGFNAAGATSGGGINIIAYPTPII